MNIFVPGANYQYNKGHSVIEDLFTPKEILNLHDTVVMNDKNLNSLPTDKYETNVYKAQYGGIIKDNKGYWNPNNWGKPVEIASNNKTMKGVPFPLLGVSDRGDMKTMFPGNDYKFKGSKVTEIPFAQGGQIKSNVQMKNQEQLVEDLTNFGNYNKKMQEGGQIKNPKTGEEVPLQGEQPESVFKKTKNNWLNKAYWTWENKKPQLLKDAEILDPIAPMLQYLSSNADSEVGLALVSPAKVLNNVGRNIVSKIPTSTLERIRNSKIINTLWPESKVFGSSPGISSKINDVIKSRIVKEKFKAKEEGINFVRDWVSNPEVQKVIAQDPHGYMFSINNLNRGYLTKPELVAGNWGQSYGDGFYRINRNLVPKDIKTTTIHEATHNLTGNHSTKRMYDIVKNAFGGEDAIEALKNANINNPEGLKQIKYLTNPTEVYARMMEIRNAFGLKPGEVVGNSIGKEAFVKGVTGNLPIEKSFFRLGALTTNSTDGGWIRFLLNSLPGTVPAGIIGGSMYMNNKAKNKE